MRFIEMILMFVCLGSFFWSAFHTPLMIINMKQYLYRNEYRLVEFEVKHLKAVTGDVYSASAIGSVEGKPEEMGIGHFFTGGNILPATAERIFSPGNRVQVYYNPKLSNFTFNSMTARFVPPERYERLTFAIHARMASFTYGPLLLSIIGWAATWRYNGASIEIKKIRKIWLTTVAIEFLFFSIVGFVWLIYFIETLHIYWLLVPILPLHFYMESQRKKWCKCPHCQASLIGSDGDSIFSKKCESCGEVF